MYSKSSGDQQQVAELRLSAVFDALDRAAVDASEVGESLLRQAEVHPLHAHAVADRPAGVENPLRVIIGGHAPNAALKIILCPQQICCIF